MRCRRSWYSLPHGSVARNHLALICRCILVVYFVFLFGMFVFASLYLHGTCVNIDAMI